MIRTRSVYQQLWQKNVIKIEIKHMDHAIWQLSLNKKVKVNIKEWSTYFQLHPHIPCFAIKRILTD